MIHRIEHALVMDTDDIPGRGGYAVVGLSQGLTQAERVFVAENFGISDYLHDPQNDRAFYSFFRVPGGRLAFVRRFAKGLRRSGSQSRVFVHTLFLDDATFAALHGLPWLLLESKFRRDANDAWQPLTLDYGPLIDTASFAVLEWQPEPDVIDDPARRLQTRLALLGKRLTGIDPADAVTTVIASLQQGRRALLPQGSAYELLTILAWSMLPIGDRETLGWTQHDSRNVAVDFAIANAPGAEFVAALNDVARRIVEMNTSGEDSRREFQTRAARYPLSVRGDAIEAWLRWREALSRVAARVNEPDAVIVAELERVARSARPNRNDPWIDGAEVLQLLWPSLQREIDSGRDAQQAATEWASRLHRSGLGAVIFREPPTSAWLDRVAHDLGADVLVRFYIFGTEGDEQGAPTRAAVAQWVVDRRERIGTDVLALLTVRLARDRSPLLEPMLHVLLDDPNALHVLAGVTPLNAAMGDMVLLASIVAVQRNHPQAAAYVRGTLLTHLERSDETRRKLNENIAFAVAEIVRGDAETFARFVSLLDAKLQLRLALSAAEAGEPAEAWAGVALKVLRSGSGAAAEWDTLIAALAKRAPRADADRMLLAFWSRIEPSAIPNVSDEIIAVTRRIDGEPRVKLVEIWTPRLRQLPQNARAERFVELVQELEQGASLKVRIELARRAIDQGTATRDTLNALDDDLWDLDSDAYSEAITDDLAHFAGVRASPLDRVRRLLDLLADPLTQPSVKLAIEERMPVELSRLGRSHWQQIVRLPAAKLLHSGSALMSIARQAGGADADAARDFEETCRELQWRDALDGIAAGRIDAQGTFTRAWKSAKRFVRHGLV